jgi:hypothetical protein
MEREMKIDTYQCDVCGKTKGDVNHWWIARSAKYGGNSIFTMTDWNDKALRSEFDVQGRDVKEKKEFHLCGSECVIKKVNEFMSSPTQQG